MSVMNLNRELFEKLVVEEKKTVVLDFWAPWCTYCRRLEPAYEAAAADAEKAGSEIIFAKLNIDEEPELARQQQVEVIPTLVLYQEGFELGSIVAPESKARIDEFLREVLQ